MDRRIAGLETEYGLSCVTRAGSRALEVEQAARDLFAPVVEWGRSSNVFLPNGSRLYLDVGSHPEFASAECSSPLQLVTVDRAGDAIVGRLLDRANSRYAEQGVDAVTHLFKNNVDSAGNTFGAHENYQIARRGEFTRVPQLLLPFLITRQIVAGSGAVLGEGDDAVLGFSLRADHVWEAVSSATTRTRPIINTRDEPHGDSQQHRRLHVIVGDSTMSESSTFFKFAATGVVLRMIEAGVPLEDLTLADEMAAIRGISRDLSGAYGVELADGRTMTAADVQERYLEQAREFGRTRGEEPWYPQLFDLWQRAIDAVRSGDHSAVDTELDWAIKEKLYRQVRERRPGLAWDSPEIRRLDLAYHDVTPGRGLFPKLVAQGRARRLVSETEVARHVDTPPPTTRASLRGRFVAAAAAAGRDFAVDWTTLKLAGPGQRPVVLLDPLQTRSEEAEALIAAVRAAPADPGLV